MYDKIINFIDEQSMEGEKMLIKFKIKNVLSFKDLVEFSMVAGSTFKNEDRLVDCNNFKLLKFSSVFGANASGKSNLIKAFAIMDKIVINSLNNYSLNYGYRLQKNIEDNNSYFETILLIDKKTYSYGFEVNFPMDKFVSEWLYELNDSGEKIIFERDAINKTIQFGKMFKADVKRKLEFYAEDVKQNDRMLLLNFLNKDKPSLYDYQEAEIFAKVYEWFTTSLHIADPNTIITSGEYFKVENKLKELSDFMQRFGTGIYLIKKSEKEQDDAKAELPYDIIINVCNIAMQGIRRRNLEGISSLVRFGKKFWIINVKKDGNIKYEKILFYHDQNSEYGFSLDDESDGTARILELAEILLSDEKNKTYIIDELDRCLHPQLTCKFIKEFLEKAKIEGNNNQLIVTTHESRLLDFNILRRDEIWFIEKKDNVSNLYSLEEFNVRFDKKIDKAYLEGRYGGIPIFDEVFPNVISGNENQNK